MKKLVLIGCVVVGGLVVSCEKQDFKPRDCNHDNIPSWEERKTVAGVSNNSTGEGNGNGITDPNNDEDGNGRKKI